MKNNILIIVTILIITCLTSCADKQGNGNIVTKNINISDYSEIEISAPVTLEYSQEDSSSYFEITTDENILDNLYIDVVGNTLYIKASRNGKKNGHHCDLHPTVLTVRTNSSQLREIDNAGSNKTKIISSIYSNSLGIEISGSGDVECYEPLFVNNFSVDISGSGSLMNYSTLHTDKVDVEISGSGKVELNGGEATYGEIEISGSGKYNALSLVFQRLEAEISGSGIIHTHVTERLEYQISGSGKLYYRGNPSLSGRVSGSGEIVSLDGN